jgi:predicted ATPase
MRDAIAWSFDLLAPEERALFRRLAVFAGGFTLERVAAVGRVPGNPISDALEGLTTLVEGSLVRRVERTGGEPRFAMLETVREFGLEQLAASGEEESVRGTHARHFLALAERSEPDIYRGCDLIRLLGALEDEHADLRAALEHLEATGAAEAFLRSPAHWPRSGCSTATAARAEAGWSARSLSDRARGYRPARGPRRWGGRQPWRSPKGTTGERPRWRRRTSLSSANWGSAKELPPR